MATAEDTIVATLQWSKLAESERQLRDVVGIVRVRGEPLDHSLVQHLVTRFGLEAEWGGVLKLAGG